MLTSKKMKIRPNYIFINSPGNPEYDTCEVEIFQLDKLTFYLSGERNSFSPSFVKHKTTRRSDV